MELKSFALTQASCPDGKTSVGGSGLCTNCPAGKFAVAGQPSCSSCPSGAPLQLFRSVSPSFALTGKFQDQAGQSSCTACSAGFAVSSGNAQSCPPCGAGTFANTTGMSAWYVRDSLVLHATDRFLRFVSLKCQPGFFSVVTGAAGPTQCEPCPIKTEAPLHGMSTCSLCAAGTFTNSTGTANCAPCTLQIAFILPFVRECVAGPAGSSQPNKGTDACILCAVTTAQPSKGQQSCV